MSQIQGSTGLDVPRSFAFINAITLAQTPAEIGDHLVDIARAFGFSSVYGGLLPRGPTSRKKLAPLTLVQHVPQAWSDRYNDRGYLFRDPVFHRLCSDPNPFTWQESYDTSASSSDRRIIVGEAESFGLIDGYVVPVMTLDPRIAAISFGGDRVDLDPEDAGRLAFAANCAIGRFLQLQVLAANTPGHLTFRERECLLWSSEGKTESEIADILEISTSTVSKHIAAARMKLNAINKAHAVAIAFRLGLF